MISEFLSFWHGVVGFCIFECGGSSEDFSDLRAPPNSHFLLLPRETFTPNPKGFFVFNVRSFPKGKGSGWIPKMQKKKNSENLLRLSLSLSLSKYYCNNGNVWNVPRPRISRNPFLKQTDSIQNWGLRIHGTQPRFAVAWVRRCNGVNVKKTHPTTVDSLCELWMHYEHLWIILNPFNHLVEWIRFIRQPPEMSDFWIRPSEGRRVMHKCRFHGWQAWEKHKVHPRFYRCGGEKILKVLLYFWFWVHEMFETTGFLMSLLHVILGRFASSRDFLLNDLFVKWFSL